MDYFIKWKGYGPESNSWVREDNMDAEELIDEYLAEHVDMVNARKANWQFYLNQEQAKKCGTTTGTVTSMAKTGNGSEDTTILQWTLNHPSS